MRPTGSVFDEPIDLSGTLSSLSATTDPSVIQATGTLTGSAAVDLDNDDGASSCSLLVGPNGSPQAISLPVTVYAYNPPPAPTVTHVSPASGPTAGGTTVTVTGTNLTGATAVDFGTVPGSNISVNRSGTQLTVTAPPGSEGTVDITVATPSGTSTTGAADRYSYMPPPAVALVMPPDAPANVGYHLTFIVGQNFTQVTTVSFGTTPTVFAVLSSVVILAVVPPEPSGTVDVRVTTLFGGTSPSVAADRFTYTPDP